MKKLLNVVMLFAAASCYGSSKEEIIVDPDYFGPLVNLNTSCRELPPYGIEFTYEGIEMRSIDENRIPDFSHEGSSVKSPPLNDENRIRPENKHFKGSSVKSYPSKQEALDAEKKYRRLLQEISKRAKIDGSILLISCSLPDGDGPKPFDIYKKSKNGELTFCYGSDKVEMIMDLDYFGLLIDLNIHCMELRPRCIWFGYKGFKMHFIDENRIGPDINKHFEGSFVKYYPSEQEAINANEKYRRLLQEINEEAKKSGSILLISCSLQEGDDPKSFDVYRKSENGELTLAFQTTVDAPRLDVYSIGCPH